MIFKHEFLIKDRETPAVLDNTTIKMNVQTRNVVLTPSSLLGSYEWSYGSQVKQWRRLGIRRGWMILSLVTVFQSLLQCRLVQLYLVCEILQGSTLRLTGCWCVLCSCWLWFGVNTPPPGRVPSLASQLRTQRRTETHAAFSIASVSASAMTENAPWISSSLCSSRVTQRASTHEQPSFLSCDIVCEKNVTHAALLYQFISYSCTIYAKICLK